MIVTQPDRILLQEQIARHAPALTGDLIDIGSGRHRRYKECCTNITSYRTLDPDARWNPDIVGSAEAIPLPDASVDSILCTQVLEHVPHPHIVLREFARIIKPGGKVLLTVPQWNEFHEVPHDYFRYTRFGLETLFTDNGFTITAMEPRGKYFSEHAQMRIRYLINRWKPYERSWAMWIVAPISILLTKYALLRDRLSTHPAAELHTIGWCVIAQKST